MYRLDKKEKGSYTHLSAKTIEWICKVGGKMPVKEMASKIGCSEPTICHHLRKAGIPVYGNSLHGDKVEQFIRMYNKNMHPDKVSQILGFKTNSTYYYWVRKLKSKKMIE